MVFDLETTGLVDGSRIVELGFQKFTPDGLEKEWVSYIDPEIPIPPEATETHKITDTIIRGCRCGIAKDSHPHSNCEEFRPWPKFGQIAGNLAKGFSDCDFAGKNIRFDLRILLGEMLRTNTQWSYAGARVIDIDRIEQIGRPRTLSHLYENYTGERLTGAHSALEDVKASATVLACQFQEFQQMPRELNELHELLWPGWVDTEGKFRVKNGKVVCTFGAHRDKPLSSIPPGYWKWILAQDFSAEIKDIASNALKGIYPNAPSS